MVHPRDRHLESQNRASANTQSIASTDTKIASINLDRFIEPLKNDKSLNSSKVTLDKLHHSHIQKFNEDKEQLQQTKMKLSQLQSDRLTLNKLPFHELNETQMRRLFFIENEIEKMQNKIKTWENNEEMTEYFMNTGDILYEYYTNLHSISKGDDERRKRSIESYPDSLDNGDSSTHTVVDFFRKHNRKIVQKNKNNSLVGVDATEYDNKDTCDDHVIVSTSTQSLDSSDKVVPSDTLSHATQAPPIFKTPYNSRQVLLNKYLEQTEPHLVAENQTYVAGNVSEVDECPDCGTERVLYHHEACLVCPNEKCMRTDNILVDSNVPAYKDTSRETTTYYSYKRINHFNEWLAQFQAKETTDIPDDVYNQIYMELKKERISNMAVVTPQKMKEILKRLKLNKYYEHIPHITNRINGQPAPVITRATEEKLRSMFKEIQGPFMKHCPPERKNFLSYSYVLHKFCQLLELDDFLQCFQLLKSREKLHVQDTIWEKICKELHWEFIKSV